MNRVLLGDCREVMRDLILDSVRVQMCVTSPPYWGLRDYGHDDQLGLEERCDCLGWATRKPCGECFICHMVGVFRQVWHLLEDDGTAWINMGDAYYSPRATGGVGDNSAINGKEHQQQYPRRNRRNREFKPKDMTAQPWRLALALQAEGWYLRQDIIWHKKNPMPESTKDRCTKAHEYVLLLAKSERYYFDQDAIREPAGENTHARRAQYKTPDGWDTSTGEGGHGQIHKQGREKGRKLAAAGSGTKNNDSMDAALAVMPETRNKRSVWPIASKPYKGAHFATFPPALIEPCILAGSRPGDVVFDPFFGSGTTGEVALKYGRQYLGIDANENNVALQSERIKQIGIAL